MKHEAWVLGTSRPLYLLNFLNEEVFDTVLAACCPLPTMPLYLPSVPPTTFPTLGPEQLGRAGGGDISAGLNSEHAPC